MTILQPGKKSSTYSLRNFSILLAEDYEFMQQLMTGMLKAFGVGNIMVCSGGDEARGLLSMMAATKSGDVRMVDIVLTDWLMPDGSGPDLIQWIRNHKSDHVRFLPIMLVSAFTSEDVVRTARNFGANEAMVKPVSGEMLSKRILSVIDNPRPFVKTADYFGPDRRRRDVARKGEDRRKMQQEMITVNHERL